MPVTRDVGEVPASLGQLSNLTIIDLSINQLRGKIIRPSVGSLTCLAEASNCTVFPVLASR